MGFHTNDPAHGDEHLMALRALRERYPYMFVAPRFGQDLYRGWLADFIIACDDIDQLLRDNKRGFHFRQIKEKLGWARYYWRTETVKPLRLSIFTNGGVLERQHGLENADDVENQISQILLNAENSSRQKCIVCSEPAESRSFGGWLVCTCERHSPSLMARDDLLHASLLRKAAE
jgi:hypothetical protein